VPSLLLSQQTPTFGGKTTVRPIPGYNLWLGNARDGRDLRAILDAGIQAVVDLAFEEPPAVLVRELTYCRFPLLDGAGNPPWLLRAAVSWPQGACQPNSADDQDRDSSGTADPVP